MTKKPTSLFVIALLFSLVTLGQNYKKTFKKALSGNDEQQVKLATAYFLGGDKAEAFKWYKKAADQGNSEAQVFVAKFYSEGVGVEQNTQEAINWYNKAALLENPMAELALGDIYYNGKGVDKDFNEALKWYTKAAEKGYAKAQNSLGQMVEKGEGIAVNHAEAMNWYKKAAEQSYAQAYCQIGHMYEHGEGVAINYVEAMNWYKKAAEQGNVTSMYNIGYMYEAGEGVTQDYDEAIKWYRKAGENGHISSQIILGTMYYEGKGVGQNYALAALWFRKAAELGETYAKSRLKEIEPLIQLPKQPANLIISGLSIYDEDRNRVINAFENAVLSFKLQNNGKGEAQNIIILAKDLNNIVGLQLPKLEQAVSLAAGESRVFNLKMKGLAHLATGIAKLQVSANESNGFDAEPAELAISTSAFEPPKVVFATNNFLSEDGGLTKKGEVVYLRLIIQNQGLNTARAVRLDFNLPAQDVFPGNDKSFDLGDMLPNDSKEIVFSFFTNSRYEKNTIPIKAKLTEAIGKYGSEQVFVLDLQKSISQTSLIKPTSNKQISGTTLNPTNNSSNLDIDKNIPINSNVKTNSFAIIIGNEEYPTGNASTNRNDEKISFARKDALSFYQYAQKTLGIPNKNILLLTDAPSAKIKQALDSLISFSKKRQGKAELYFYYSGLGAPSGSNRQASLIPVDAIGNKEKDAIKIEELCALLVKHPCARAVAIIDACFNGKTRNEYQLKPYAIDENLQKKTSISGNIALFCAASVGQTAYALEDTQHGLFTYHLLKNLQNSPSTTLVDWFNRTSKDIEASALKRKIQQTPQLIIGDKLSNDILKTWTTK